MKCLGKELNSKKVILNKNIQVMTPSRKALLLRAAKPGTSSSAGGK
jgi:hypothetical protein